MLKKVNLFFLAIFLSIGLLAQQYVPSQENVCRHFQLKEDPLELKHRAKSEFYEDYDVKFYFLDIQLDANSTYVQGNASTTAEIKVDDLNEFKLELIDALTVDSVFIDDELQTFTHGNDLLSINMLSQNVGNIITAKVYYHGQPSSGGFFSGISNSITYFAGQAFPVTWTLSDPYQAKQWWPSKQDLNDKADSAWCFITTDTGVMAGSNGMLTSITALENNKIRYEWKTKYPIVYYLISAAVSNYMDYSFYAHITQKPGDSLLVQNFIYNHEAFLNLHKNKIDATAGMIQNFSDFYGVYPFWEEKYGHCVSRIGGGMEHQTMTTINGFDHKLVCHELSHQWFGNYVTCGTWSDIWVNEGFARYSEYISLDNLVGHQAAQSRMSSMHANVMSSPGGSVYVPENETDDVWRIFDGRLTYDKGGSILHMLRFELQNDSLFFLSYRNYLNQYANGWATGDDFKNIVEQTAGVELDGFFEQWYYGEGYPTFSIQSGVVDDTLFMQVTQSTSTMVTPLFKMLVEYELTFEDGSKKRIKLFQNENLQTFKIPVEQNVAAISIDPDNWVLNKVGQITIDVENVKSDMQFHVFPNPLKDSMRLYCNQNMANGNHQLQIMDMAGRIIYAQPITKEHMVFNVSSIKPGSYIAFVEYKGSVKKQKIVIY